MHVRAAVVDFMSDYDALNRFGLCGRESNGPHEENCREYRQKLKEICAAWMERCNAWYTDEETREALRKIELGSDVTFVPVDGIQICSCDYMV